MIIHQREFGYTRDYQLVFEALAKAKAYLEEKYPQISMELMYNLAGQRGRVTIQTHYPSLADYELIDAEADNDETYAKLLEPVMNTAEPPVVDQFYRVIESS
jgi:hypothetical protein